MHSTSFEALGVSAPLVAALAAEGISEPFAIQALCLADAYAGRDVCGKAKNGSGKNLAFGLPLLERIGKAEPHRPRALVLVPTRELANQVENVLAPLGLMQLALPRLRAGARVISVTSDAGVEEEHHDRKVAAILEPYPAARLEQRREGLRNRLGRSIAAVGQNDNTRDVLPLKLVEN